MKLWRMPVIVLALAALIAPAGCGDDEEETLTTISTESKPLSPEVYAGEAETVLVGFAGRFQQLSVEIGGASGDELGGLVGEAEADIQSVIEEFDAIEPPEEAQEGHDQILAALEDFSSKLTDIGDAASGGDKAESRAVVGDLQSAAVEFQRQLLAAVETLAEDGIEIGEPSGSPAGG